MNANMDARKDRRPLRPRRVLTHTFGVLAVVAIALSSMGVSAAPKGPPDSRTGPANEAPDLASLIAAAQAEGSLNVIALPRDWCNYGELIDGFASTFEITVNEINPGAGSADELQAIRDGGPYAPDAIDVGPGFAVQAESEGLITAYEVATWDTIPDFMKDREGYWYGDYSGLMAIAANTDWSAAPMTWQDLLDRERFSPVALGGDPTVSNMGLFSVYGAALANGGSLDNIEPGVQFFRELREAGQLLPVIGNGDALASGETPVLPEWSYLALAQRDASPQVSTAIPRDGSIGSFYAQAISASAPHPNAARLWMEYLYSDEGQLAFAEGYCIPARYDDMKGRGVIPDDVLARLPTPEELAEARFPSVDQASAAKSYVEANWLCTVYGYGCPPAETPKQPTTKDQCKNNGWRSYPHAGFRNQGDCVSFVSSGRFVCRDALGCASYKQDKPVRIATALTLNGDLAFLGLDSQRGVEIALSQQGALFGHALELRAEDDGCGPDGGAAAASLIAADRSISAVVGTTCSSAADTAAPIISAAGLSMVSPSSTSPYLTDPATHSAGFLRTAWNDMDNAYAMAKFLRVQQKQTSFVIVQAGSNYSETIGQAFAAAFEVMGGRNLGIEAADESGEGIDTVLDAVIEAGPPEVLYFAVFDPLASAIVSGVRSRDELDGTVMASTDAFYSQEFIDSHWPDVEGMLFGMADDSFTQSPAYASFREEFLSRYDVEPLAFTSPYAYDATTMILRGMERVAVTDGRGTLYIGRQALRSVLFATEGLAGLTGTITCDAYGDCSAASFKIIQGEPTSTFVAYLPFAIEGYRWPMGHDITVSINGGEYGSTAMSEQRPDSPPGETRVLFDLGKDAFALESGDHIVMTDPVTGVMKETVVTKLAVTGFDLSARTVTGVSDPASSIWVWIYDGESQEPTRDTGSGVWTATFGELPPGAWGGATQMEMGDGADGDGTSVDYLVPSARFTVFPEWEAFELWQWPIGASVHLTIEDPATPDSPDFSSDYIVPPADWNPEESFLWIDISGDYDVKPGDEVTITTTTGVGITVSHTVRSLTVDLVRTDQNTVSGTAGSDAEPVYVWPHDGWPAGTHAYPVGGNWTADLDDLEYDLVQSTTGRAEIVDAIGNTTGIDWAVPRIAAYPEGDFVIGWDWRPHGADVHLGIDDPTNGEGIDFRQDAKVEPTPFNPDFWWVKFDFAGKYDLKPGDIVSVTDGTTTREHTVLPLTVDPIDAEVDAVTGTSYGGASVYVHPWDTLFDAATEADLDGEWSMDFMGRYGYDLQLGTWGVAEVFDDAGNSTSIDWRAEQYWGWVFTYDPPAGTWTFGEHNYYFEMAYTVPEPGSDPNPDPPRFGFTIDPTVGPYEGKVLLRPGGLRARIGEECPVRVEPPVINPEEETRFVWGWVTDWPMSEEDALAHFGSMRVWVHWDEGPAVEMVGHGIVPGSEFGTLVCSMTE